MKATITTTLFYLLFTFLLGALFPLIQFQDGSRILPAVLDVPVGRVIAAKENVILDTYQVLENFRSLTNMISAKLGSTKQPDKKDRTAILDSIKAVKRVTEYMTVIDSIAKKEKTRGS